MVEFTLKPVGALDEYSQDFAGVSVAVFAGMEIISLDIARGREPEFRKIFSSQFGVEMPDHGNSVVAKTANARILRMQDSRLLLMFNQGEQKAISTILNKAAKYISTTILSDGLVVLQICGENPKAILERMCAIDLHSDVFCENNFARTQMVHQTISIICENENSYLMLVARSSAKSFLHEIETSVGFVV